MITVLSVLTLASVLALAAAESGHLALGGSRNRIAETRAFWIAQGCAAQVVATLDERWARSEGDDRNVLWRSLDSVTARLSQVAGLPCDVRLESGAARLDLARAGVTGLARLIAVVAPDVPSNRVAVDVIAWRDSLVAVNENGRRAPLRRNALVEHLREHQGLTTGVGARIAEVLSNGSGPVDVGRAPLPVLAALPGFNQRTAEALITVRSLEPNLRDLYSMLGRLSREDADDLSRAFLELSQDVVFLPTCWSLIVTRHEPHGPAVTVTWRIGRSTRHFVAEPAAG